MVVAVLVWFALRPALDRVIAGSGELLIRAWENPRVTRLVVVDHRAQLRRIDLRAGSKVFAVSLTENHFNTIILLALAFCLPRPWGRRQLDRLGFAWALLLVSQVVNLVAHVEVLYANSLGAPNAAGIGEWSAAHYSDFARNVWGYVRYFTDIPGRFGFPFLAWVGLNWDLVTPSKSE